MARYMCQKMRLFPKLLSNSRLNRRIHKISWSCWSHISFFWLFLQEMIQAPLTLLWIAFQFPIVRKIELIKESVFLEHRYIGFAASKKSIFAESKFT